MRNEVSYQKIRAYLLGELPPDQVKDVEDLMTHDPEFAEAVETLRKLQPALDRLNERGLQANFINWKAELAAEATTRRKTRRRWLYIAAGFVIALLALLLLISRKSTGPLYLPLKHSSDSLQQPPAIRPPDTLRHSGQTPPVAGPPAKDQPQPNAQSRITAARQIAREQIASLIPAVPAVRGKKANDNWQPVVRTIDSLILQQQYTKASQLIAGTDIPEAYRLPRQAYLELAQDKPQAALDSYRRYLKTIGDPDEADWGLALFYLAAFPDRQPDFWKKLDAIRTTPRHKYREAAEQLRSALSARGIVPI